MKWHRGKNLLLLNQFWEHKMLSRTHSDRHIVTRGSCEQQSSPGVAVHPDEGWQGGWGCPTSAGVSPKGLSTLPRNDGNTGVCVLRRYVQLLNSRKEWAPARHWLELRNTANVSCQGRENLQSDEEIINPLVNISGADRDLGEDKKS